MMKTSFFEKIGTYFADLRLLLRSVPPLTFALFILALFVMNLLANKSIALPFDWLALDCGIFVSWFVFLALNVLTKHFGPAAATALSYFASFIYLCICGVFYLIGMIPGVWGASVGSPSDEIVNEALNGTFGGTWYIILGSVVAFSLAATVNNFLHFFVRRLFFEKSGGKRAFVCASYVSSAAAQFCDNFTFSFIVSRAFFGWSVTQCTTGALIGAGVELFCEGIFIFWGYRICENWQKNKVGEEYLRGKKQGAR